MALSRPKPSALVEAELAQAVARFRHDPLGFVMFAFPWGVPGTKLADKTGPEEWQRKVLVRLGEHSFNMEMITKLGFERSALRMARASGHGVGKSALVAWVILWLMSTRPDMRGVVTATTSEQLETKTWPELSKWHAMVINAHWFGLTATSIYFAVYPEEKRKNYSVMAQTVSKDRTEAFQGLHNEGGTVLVIFDEASGVEPKVWEAAEGAMTDGEVFFLAFGNPTRPDGEFYECFHAHKALYDCDFIDSRHVTHTNKENLRQTIMKYGEDSDIVKVRVYGMFPSSSFDGFIPMDACIAAVEREVVHDATAALVMGVDVGRSERGDPTVIRFRQGRDARSIPPVKLHERDNVTVARRCADLIGRYKPDAVCVDATGVGSGVVDILRSWGYKVIEVHLGVKFESTSRWYNKRAKLYDECRGWLYEQGCIADDRDLISQATAVMYKLDKNKGCIIIEPKEDMRERLGRSPDDFDALVLTFDVPVIRRNNLLTAGVHARNKIAADYDELAV